MFTTSARRSVLCLALLTACSSEPPADLILHNGEIYTMTAEQPWASAVVINGNQIVAVLADDSEIEAYRGEGTRVVDLGGKLTVPGFVDAHTHFAGFGAQQNDIYLMGVTDDAGLREEVARVVEFLPDGEWITGGRWEAFKTWEADWREREALKDGRWQPTREVIDPVSPAHPCFVNSYDRELYLANTLALEAAGLVDAPVEGMKLDADGRPTGLIYRGSPAIARIQAERVGKTEERILNELRAGLQVMAQRGITEIHDMSSTRQMERYAKLQESGELTARVWGRPHLLDAQRYADEGIQMNAHPVTGERDRYLRVGAFKGHYDGLMGSHGALLFEPYVDRPDTHGTYRQCTSDARGFRTKSPEKFFELGKIAMEAGFSINTHAIGTRGISELLDDYERLVEASGQPLDRFRVIHGETVIPTDFDRFAAMDVIAEVNPNSMEDDMRWVIDRLGPEREKLVFPLRSYIDKGVRLTIGSDIPGAAGAEFSNHPALAIHAAVHRTKPDGTPAGGWIPEQKITVHEALEAFTVNGAYAVYDDDVRGTIAPGMLADFAVCSVNIVKETDRILDMEIDMTIVDGRIVFDRATDEVRKAR